MQLFRLKLPRGLYSLWLQLRRMIVFLYYEINSDRFEFAATDSSGQEFFFLHFVLLCFVVGTVFLLRFDATPGIPTSLNMRKLVQTLTGL